MSLRDPTVTLRDPRVTLRDPTATPKDPTMTPRDPAVSPRMTVSLRDPTVSPRDKKGPSNVTKGLGKGHHGMTVSLMDAQCHQGTQRCHQG